MKKKYYLTILTLAVLLVTMSCSKQEVGLPTPKVVKVNFRGIVLEDTLELVDNGVMIQTINPQAGGFSVEVLVNVPVATKDIIIRKKGTTASLGTLKIKDSPFSQTQKFFYDGITVAPDVQLTKVTNPENMGIRLAFKTSYAYFKGAPVDIELYVRTIDFNTFETSYVPYKIIKNVTASFGDFIELPPIVTDENFWRSYCVRVFDASSDTMTFKPGVNTDYYNVEDGIYGSLDDGPPFKSGDSRLYMIDLNYDRAYLYAGYRVYELSGIFK